MAQIRADLVRAKEALGRWRPSPRPLGASRLGTALSRLAPGPEDMKALGAALAGLLRPGDTVLLGGDLGCRQDDLHPGPGRCPRGSGNR